MEADPAEAIFGTESPDLYAVLSVPSDAPTSTITSAYRKLALKYHPDKISPLAGEEEKLEARKQFERIGYAYKVLSDEKRRKRWEETGRTDESFLEGGDEASWAEYFKDLWSGVVNASTITEFSKKYKGSADEAADLHAAYLECDGSLDRIFEHVMLSNPLDDESRFITIIDEAISSGKLPSLPSWQKEKKDKKARTRRRKAAEAEAKEAEEMAKEMGVHDELFGNGGSSSGAKGKRKRKAAKGKNEEREEEDEYGGPEGEETLRALIHKRQADRSESFIDRLEAKALAEDAKDKKRAAKRGGKGKGKKKAGDDDDGGEHDEEEATGGKKAKKNAPPSEEEFQKLQAEMFSRRTGTSATTNGTSSKGKGRKGAK